MKQIHLIPHIRPQPGFFPTIPAILLSFAIPNPRHQMQSNTTRNFNAPCTSFVLERQRSRCSTDKLVRAALLAGAARTSRAQPPRSAQPEARFLLARTVAARAIPDAHPGGVHASCARGLPRRPFLAEGGLESRHGRAAHAQDGRCLFEGSPEQRRQKNRLTLSQGLD